MKNPHAPRRLSLLNLSPGQITAQTRCCLASFCAWISGTLETSSYSSIEERHRTADIGLLIGDKTEWGKDHTSEAIAALTEYAFNQLNIAKLTAGCYTDNEGSRRAFLKVDYVEEGRRISQCFVDGKR